LTGKRTASAPSVSQRPRSGLAVTLDSVYDYVTRYVHFRRDDDATAVVLWIAHTHALEYLDFTPRLILVAPEMQSGKSRVLECLHVLCPRAIMGMNMSVPYLFRILNQQPTVLYDEIDMIFAGEDRANRKDLQSIMNSGHHRGATVGRVETAGGVRVPVNYPTFGPMAIAGNELPPGTVVSRAITVTMFRRKPSQHIDSFTRNSEAEALPIKERLEHWGETQGPQLVDPRPLALPGITDRAADVWNGLLAIAELAGDDWTQRARHAAVLFTAESRRRAPSQRVDLLTDIQVIMDNLGVKADQGIASRMLIENLHSMDTRGWGHLTPYRLSQMLQHFTIGPPQTLHPPTIISPDGKAAKGYMRHWFLDAWDSYLD
jgi:hypothetical protein